MVKGVVKRWGYGKILLVCRKKSRTFKWKGENMKKWETPSAIQEDFLANSVVSACYEVACNTEAAKAWERNRYGSWDLVHNHEKDHCGNSKNQVLVTDTDNNVTGMKEVGTSGWNGHATLPCTIYTDDTYSVKESVQNLNNYVGKTVYWMTTNRLGTDFHHQGTFNIISSDHPLRS